MKKKKALIPIIFPGIVCLLLFPSHAGGELRDIDPVSWETIDEQIKNSDFPAKFDLRDVDGVNYISPVKNQGDLGSCAAFATAAAAESSLTYELRNSCGMNIDNKSIDLSEHHMLWFVKEPLPGDTEDTNAQKGEGIDGDPYIGITSKAYLSLFAQGVGPVPEVYVPYRGKKGVVYYENFSGYTMTAESREKVPSGCTPKYYSYNDDDWSLDESLRFESDYVLEEGLFLSDYVYFTDGSFSGYDPDAVTAIKKELMNGHAVFASYLSDDIHSWWSESVYISPFHAHYTYSDTESYSTDHSICIVGWDDSFSKDKFLQGKSEEGCDKAPPADGAWIVKNSWGSLDSDFPDRAAWGIDGKGYFMLSYYDKSLCYPISLNFMTEYNVTEKEPVLIHQYDYMPVRYIDEYYSDEPLCYGNKYKFNANEYIDAVGFYTLEKDTAVTVTLLKNSSKYDRAGTGKQIIEKTQIFPVPGYHTIKFDSQVKMPKDSYIFVQIEQLAYGVYTVPYAYGPVSDEDGQNYISVVNDGESFVLWNDEWEDWKDWADDLAEDNSDNSYDNLCVKLICRYAQDESLLTSLPGSITSDVNPATGTENDFAGKTALCAVSLIIAVTASSRKKNSVYAKQGF